MVIRLFVCGPTIDENCLWPMRQSIKSLQTPPAPLCPSPTRRQKLASLEENRTETEREPNRWASAKSNIFWVVKNARYFEGKVKSLFCREIAWKLGRKCQQNVQRVPPIVNALKIAKNFGDCAISGRFSVSYHPWYTPQRKEKRRKKSSVWRFLRVVPLLPVDRGLRLRLRGGRVPNRNRRRPWFFLR